IEFQPIQDDARGFHDIVANSVTRHPCDFVFGHSSVPYFSFSIDHRRNGEIRMTKPETNPNDEEPSSRNSDFGINSSFVIRASSFIWLRAKPRRHQIFGAARDN